MRINHVRAALGCSIIACLGSAAVAVADPTDNEGQMSQRTYVTQQPYDISSAVCGFPVHVGFPVDDEYIVKSSTAADGTTTLRITGQLSESLTNTDTGKTLTEQVNGPATIVLRADGSLETLDGQGAGILVFGPHSQATFGVPGIDLTHGHVIQQVDATGRTTSLSLSGTQTDLCGQLG